jgi:hypothetical protein
MRAATQEIIKEANSVGETAELVVSEATEIAGIAERLQSNLQHHWKAHTNAE